MNQVTLIGQLNNGQITTTRPSGLTDTIPAKTTQEGYVKIIGSLYTHNTKDRHLKMYVQPDIITPSTESSDNTITLTGYLCRTPNHRYTPGGREITDLLVACNDGIKSNYIPVITWGKIAKEATRLHMGDKITIEGRIQSREYLKNEETKITYEVSANKIKVEE